MAGAAGEPQVTVGDITVDEPHAGETGSMPFTVTLEFPAATELTVPWRFYPGKPDPWAFTQTVGQLVFAPGEQTKTLSFPLQFDPTDNLSPYYYTLEISPNWRNLDQYGVATVHDTTRNGTFICTATAYETSGTVPLGTLGAGFSGTLGGQNCPAAVQDAAAASYGGGSLTVARRVMRVVRYADNSVYSQPSVGDGGESHVRLDGVVWRVAPGLVLRAASVASDSRIVCTAVGELPLMVSSSSVTGLSINGAPALGTITNEQVFDVGGDVRVAVNEHRDQAGTIAGGPQKGEPHRSLAQTAIHVSLKYQNADLAATFVVQMEGNPCAS
jgi:hypothetical protein